jgi:hypothetical protein
VGTTEEVVGAIKRAGLNVGLSEDLKACWTRGADGVRPPSLCLMQVCSLPWGHACSLPPPSPHHSGSPSMWRPLTWWWVACRPRCASRVPGACLRRAWWRCWTSAP